MSWAPLPARLAGSDYNFLIFSGPVQSSHVVITLPLFSLLTVSRENTEVKRNVRNKERNIETLINNIPPGAV